MQYKMASSKVCIKVGDKLFEIEKDVLMKQSKYFDAMFGGNFVETKSKDIDLTKDISDVDAFERLVEYICTDKIVFELSNLRKGIDLATFLMVDSLLEKYVNYMKKELSVVNVFQFHFLALEFGLIELLPYTETFLSSRFHDLLVFKEYALDLTCDQLKILAENGCTKYCGYLDFISFLAKWLVAGNDKDDASDRLEIVLDFIEQRKVQGLHKCPSIKVENEKLDEFQKLIDRLSNTWIDKAEQDKIERFVKVCNDSLEDLKKNTGKHSGKKDETNQVSNDTKERKEGANVGRNIPADDKGSTTVALFTLSKRTDTRLTENSMEEDHYATCEDSQYDILVFNAKTQVWHYVADLSEVYYMYNVSDEQYNANGFKNFDEYYSWTEALSEGEPLEFETNGRYIALAEKGAELEDLTIFSVQTKKWNRIDFSNDIFYELEDNSTVLGRAFSAVLGPDNELFILILAEIIVDPFMESDESEEEGINIRQEENNGKMTATLICYTFDLATMEYKKLNEGVPMLALPDSEVRCMNARYSDNHDTIIVYLTFDKDTSIMYKIDTICLHKTNKKGQKVRINSKNLSVEPELIWKTEGFSFTDTRIHESDESFMIFNKEFEDLLSPCIQYTFSSGEVSLVTNGTPYLLSNKSETNETVKIDRVEDVKSLASINTSFWQLEQKLGVGNLFREVRYTNAGQYDVIDHKPPPFVEVRASCAVVVDEAMFDNLKPAVQFLLPED
ncbi:uncharacterized protein LOC128211826 [Mya arenaria]|uniref:uncharacterized protein LOC128211826 n=1 Tax=Mya arenaria TaxID=6604 RepID=UPI0022E12606|nr:uncharacterized protein LOC128211826 [Mya arenaria]